MTDLFTAGLAPGPDGTAGHWPLARRMRPLTVDDIVGQDHLTGPGRPLATLIERGAATSVLLWGPPGCGKTTIAGIIASSSGAHAAELSAINATVKDVRAVISSARDRLGTTGQRTVLFIDEIHRFSKSQQDSLLPAVEDGVVVLVAATTENPSFTVIRPLASRSLLLKVAPLTPEAVADLLDRAISDPRGLGGSVTITDDARATLAARAGGDARKALTVLEAAARSASDTDGAEVPQITTETLARVADAALVAYDRAGDAHYDTASALIKSIRGSDVDAALHYLAVMVDGGEDVAFVTRRLMISAAEDIGTADPAALTLAVSAHTAATSIGWPEARIPLAEAVVYLALAPKSNAAYAAINAALADVRAGKGGKPPAALRDASYSGAKQYGHGAGYAYAHDAPHGVAAQQYPPDDLVGVDYFEPTDRGVEGRWRERLAGLRRIVRDMASSGHVRHDAEHVGSVTSP